MQNSRFIDNLHEQLEAEEVWMNEEKKRPREDAYDQSEQLEHEEEEEKHKRTRREEEAEEAPSDKDDESRLDKVRCSTVTSALLIGSYTNL